MINQVLDHTGKEMKIEAFHPGEFLLEEVEMRLLVKKDVATALDMLPSDLSEIFMGKRNISLKTALKIEQLLNVSADYWLSMQMEYDLYIGRSGPI